MSRLTFVSSRYDEKNGFKTIFERHRVVRLGFETDTHDIPVGFSLTAACNKGDTASFLDFEPCEPSETVPCLICFPSPGGTQP